jgi:hypothetical protein
MACDLSTKIATILAAYADLCALCCDPTTACEGLLPENTADMCGDGDGLVTEIQAAVVALLADEESVDCSAMTEDDDYPNPGAPDGCLDAEYLDALFDWISHITCEPSGECYHIMVRFKFQDPPSCGWDDNADWCVWEEDATWNPSTSAYEGAHFSLWWGPDNSQGGAYCWFITGLDQATGNIYLGDWSTSGDCPQDCMPYAEFGSNLNHSFTTETDPKGHIEHGEGVACDITITDCA